MGIKLKTEAETGEPGGSLERTGRHITLLKELGMLVRIIAATLILGILLAGCREAPKAPVGPRERVVIDLALPQACLVQIAFTKGFFADEGIDATLRLQTSGKTALQGVLTGNADLATVAETPIVFARLEGKRASIIATIATASKNLAVVARKDHGISNPADLQQKRVGVTLGTNGEFLMDTILIANGIERGRIKIVNLEPDAMVSALVSGKVDAVATWQPHVIRLQKELGDRGVTFYNEELYTENYNLVTRPEYVVQNPETVKKLLRALVKAEEFAGQNPDEAKRILAGSTGMDKALADEVWGSFDLRVTLQHSLVIAMEDLARWALQKTRNDTARIHDYQADIYPAGLLTVRPESVRLIR